MTTTSLARWANERLTEWLREDDPIFDLLTEIREGVLHMIDCDGRMHECGDDWRTGTCECKPEACEDCTPYRTGAGPGFWATRPTLELVDELTMRLERRDDERRAS